MNSLGVQQSWNRPNRTAISSSAMHPAENRRETTEPCRSGAGLISLARWELDSMQASALVAVLAVSGLVYLRCLGNGLVFDDHAEFGDNRLIAQWSFIWKALFHDVWWFRNPRFLPQSSYFRPLQNVWFGLGFHLFGRNPQGWHAAKIVLHLIAVALSFRAAQLLTGDVTIGLVAALLFGLAPSHVEAVAWASAIPEPLATTFELGSLCCFIGRNRVGKHGFLWALVLFGLASCSHETAILFPLLIALYVLLFETGGDRVWQRVSTAVLRCAPFVAISAAYFGARVAVLGASVSLGFAHRRTWVEFVNEQAVTHLAYTNHSVGVLLMTVPRVLATYLAMLALPWVAGPAHSARFVTSLAAPAFYLPVAVLAVAGIAIYAAAKRTDRVNLALYCAMWMLLGLAPALALDQIFSIVQDRYVYFSSFGWCLMFAAFGVDFARRRPSQARIAQAALVGFVLAGGIFVWSDQSAWLNDAALWARCVEMAPADSKYRSLLAATLQKEGDREGAVRQMEAAVRTDPQNAALHYRLRRMYLAMGRQSDAARELHEYLRLSAPWALRYETPPTTDPEEDFDPGGSD